MLAMQRGLLKNMEKQPRKSRRKSTPLATTLERADTFWPAEDYHQAYLEKGGQSAAKGEQTPIRCYG